MKVVMIFIAIIASFVDFYSVISLILGKNKSKAKRRIAISSAVLLAIIYGLMSEILVEVPYTVGGNVENAIQTFQEKGFKNILIDPDPYDPLAKVISQEPSEGYKFKNTKIRLHVEENNSGDVSNMTTSSDSSMEDEEMGTGQENTNETEFEEAEPSETGEESNSSEFDDTYESYFNLTETHHPDDAMNSCYINNWSKDEDIDVRGQTYEKGILYKFSNTLALLGGNSADEIQSDLRFAYIPGSPKPSIFRAKAVLHNDSAGTNAFAKIKVIVDDETYWESEEINGNTIREIPIEIDISEMEYYFTIHIDAMPYGDGIKLGIVDYEFE